MFNPDTHYHITTISGQISVPSVVKQDEIEAMLEWTKMTEYVQSQIGIEVQTSSNNEAKFFDGTIVRMTKCHGNCLK